MFFIWFNDTTFERHYWNQDKCKFLPGFENATKFDDRATADACAENCELRFTQAQAIVQEYNPPESVNINDLHKSNHPIANANRESWPKGPKRRKVTA